MIASHCGFWHESRRRGEILGILASFALVIVAGAVAAGADPPAAKSVDGGSAAKTVEPPGSAKKGHVPRYEFHQRHDPNGIGKFYYGREIARVMGYSGIDWLERPKRESEEHIRQLVDSLKLTPGMTVADIGAGSGVISILLAQKVGSEGTVQAVDIQEEMLSVLSKRVKQLGITNVKTVRGTEKSPNLKPDTVDLALMVDVYHEFRFPYEMLSQISKALKPHGRVVFVEYRKEDPNVLIKLVHKMTQAQVKREAHQPELKLRFVETIEVLPLQHVIVFERMP